MFKRFFSNDTPTAAKTETMGEPHAVTAAENSGKQFWRDLNLAKGKNKVYRRLKDIVGQMPEHIVNRIRLIDDQLARVLTSSHKIVSLVIHEVMIQNESNPLMLEGSREWDAWYEGFEKKCFAFRRDIAEDLKQFLLKLQYREKDIDRLNSLVTAKPGELEQLTGLDKIDDVKSNLIDIAVLLGRDSESQLVNSMTEEPVRNIIDSFEYNLEFFEKTMGASSSKVRSEIEKCWKALTLGPASIDINTAGGASNNAGSQSVSQCNRRKTSKTL
jgi:hypothetical protein